MTGNVSVFRCEVSDRPLSVLTGKDRETCRLGRNGSTVNGSVAGGLPDQSVVAKICCVVCFIRSKPDLY